MRDPETGKVLPAARLQGFFRRICRLHFHGIRPVFVFDGATPEIKRRELQSRRKKREQFATLDDEGVQRLAKRLLAQNLKKQQQEKQLLQRGLQPKTNVNANANANQQAFAEGFNPGDEEEEAVQDPNIADNHAQAQEAVVDLTLLEADEVEVEAAAAATRDETVNDWDIAVAMAAEEEEEEKSNVSEDPQYETFNDFGDNNNHDDGNHPNRDPNDYSYIASLPPSKRKEAIEKAKKQQRLQSRKEFMPAAANPADFSQVQLTNFLRSTHLNQSIKKMAVEIVNKDNTSQGLEGEVMASDPTTRIVLERETDNDDNTSKNGKRKGPTKQLQQQQQQQRLGVAKSKHTFTHNESEEEEEEEEVDWEDDDDFNQKVGLSFEDSKPAARLHPLSPPAKKRRKLVDTSDEESSDDLEDTKPAARVHPLSPPAKKRRKIVDTSDEESSDDESQVEVVAVHHQSKGRGQASVPLSQVARRKVIELDADLDGSSSSSDADGNGFMQKNRGAQHAGAKNVIHINDSDSDSAVETGGFLKNDSGTTKGFVQVDDDNRIANNGDICESAAEAGGFLNNQDDATKDDATSEKEKGNVTDSGGDAGGFLTNGGGATKDAIKGVIRDGLSTNIGRNIDSVAVMLGLDVSQVQREDGAAIERSASNDAVCAQELEDRLLAQALQETEDADTGQRNGDVDVWGNEPSVGSRQEVCLNSSSTKARGDVNNSTSGQSPAKGNSGDHNNMPANVNSDLQSSDEDAVDWEDGESTGAGGAKVDDDVDDDDVGWENGEGSDSGDAEAAKGQSYSASAASAWGDETIPSQYVKRDTEEAKTALNTRRPVSEPYSTETNAALERAEASALNLAGWAGRAFRRAMKEVKGEDYSTTQRTNEVDSPGIMKYADHTRKEGDESKEYGDDRAFQEERTTTTQTASISAIRLSQARKGAGGDGSESRTGRGLPAALPAQSESTTEALIDDLQQYEDQWTAERNQRERDMDTVTDEMQEEVIQLLQLFGIPYVIAPAEAEAQAAALEQLGLVDGIVTEDSDVFVFGGSKVYRHIFEDKKYAEAYLAKDAAKELGLGRNELVALAMLLGGDYTEGVKGVGIVNSMEVLEAFDVSVNLEEGLEKFRKWLDGFDPLDVLARRIDNSSELHHTKEQTFHSKHRTARTRWIAPANFPADNVMQVSSYTCITNGRT
jgi:5'-3' exonuclease